MHIYMNILAFPVEVLVSSFEKNRAMRAADSAHPIAENELLIPTQT
jgi:hypothetical protein